MIEYVMPSLDTSFEPLRDVYNNEQYPSYQNMLWIPEILSNTLYFNHEKYENWELCEKVSQQLWHLDVAAYTALKKSFPLKSFTTVKIKYSWANSKLREWVIDMSLMSIKEFQIRWRSIYIIKYGGDEITFIENTEDKAAAVESAIQSTTWTIITQSMTNIFNTLNWAESIAIVVDLLDNQQLHKWFSIQFKYPWKVGDSLARQINLDKWVISLINQNHKVLTKLIIEWS